MSGNQENVTCLVKNFYPQRLQLTWLENGNKSRTETASTPGANKDGTFSWRSWLLVNLSAHREGVALTCLVEHDGQPAVSTNLTVKASARQKDQSTGGSSGEAPTLTDPALMKSYCYFPVISSTLYLLQNNLDVYSYIFAF